MQSKKVQEKKNKRKTEKQTQKKKEAIPVTLVYWTAHTLIA